MMALQGWQTVSWIIRSMRKDLTGDNRQMAAAVNRVGKRLAKRCEGNVKK